MQGKQLDPIPLLLPLNLLLLVPFGHLLEKVKTKVLERWCALPLSLLYSFSAAAVTASWQLHTVNRFMKAMCIQALPSTLLSCQEQNNLGNVYSSRSIHIVYVYSSPCVHIHHVYLSSTFNLMDVNVAKIHFMVLTILKFQKLFWNNRFLIFPKKVTEISAMCSIPKPHQPPQEPYFDISILLNQNETILRKW